MLLDALVGMGLLTKQGSRYGLTDTASQHLVKDAPAFVRESTWSVNPRSYYRDQATNTPTGSPISEAWAGGGSIAFETGRLFDVVSVGTVAEIPDLDGLDRASVWTSEDVFTTSELPGSALVLGGGPVGCEIAQVLARFGARVTIVQRAARLISAEEPAVGETLADVLELSGHRVRVAVDGRSGSNCRTVGI